VAGLIVTNDPVTKKLHNYHWAGYLSIAILLLSVFAGVWLKKNSDNL
jgi:hypothetical protein